LIISLGIVYDLIHCRIHDLAPMANLWVDVGIKEYKTGNIFLKK